MKPKELKRELDRISSELMGLGESLAQLEPDLKLNMDKVALEEIVTNCHWAAENTTIIGLHQIGEALDDNMGLGLTN